MRVEKLDEMNLFIDRYFFSKKNISEDDGFVKVKRKLKEREFRSRMDVILANPKGESR